jgi:hypothetical protein
MPWSSPVEREVARRLAALSTREIVSALGLEQRGTILGASAALLAQGPSLRLGRLLARFDSRVEQVGLPRAAGEALGTFGARYEVIGNCPSSGPVLVVTNHPGAFDALALMAALDRISLRRTVSFSGAFHMLRIISSSFRKTASDVGAPFAWLEMNSFEGAWSCTLEPVPSSQKAP